MRRKHKLSVRGYLAHVRKEAARLKLENQALQVCVLQPTAGSFMFPAAHCRKLHVLGCPRTTLLQTMQSQQSNRC